MIDNESGLPSFAGSLLLANPAMRDPNFSRAVIFMAAHSASDGAFGYILNRPLDKVVSDLLPDQSLGALGDVPVFLGGPVSTDKLAFASLRWDKMKSRLKCQTHLSVSDAIVELTKGNEVRAFVGYSGWTEGQLEGELKRRSWIITPPRSVVLKVEKPRQLWRALLEDMGPVFRLIAQMPEDTSMN